MERHFDPDELRDFAAAVLVQAGIPGEPAEAVARGLVEADLYGHVTHGLALLAQYVTEIANGRMTTDGRPTVLADTGPCATWDARRLPGVWTTMLAVDSAVARAVDHGLGAIAIRNSHHIACLAAYLEAPARAGNLVLIFSSNPGAAHVAPYGGITPFITPDPVAAGIPSNPDPIILDISMSITTAAMVARESAAGAALPGEWLIGVDGKPTSDPNALKAGGAILPIGGLDHGHKGFALGLLVEALTQGLSGYGRAEAPAGQGAAVLVLAFAPERFAGADAFVRETTWLADAARRSKPVDPDRPVRLPGQLALERKRRAEREGVPLSAGVIGSLKGLAAEYDVPLPPERPA